MCVFIALFNGQEFEYDLSVAGHLTTWDGGADGVSIYGSYLYLAEPDGLSVVDISNPPEPAALVWQSDL